MLITEKSAVPVKSLYEYLTSERTLVIPPWQREYAWEANDSGQVGQLLADLREFVESPLTDYLIGSVIICRLENDRSKDLVIDGQQRTLTFLLLLMCARKYIRTHSLIDNHNDQHSKLVIDLKNCLSSVQEEYKHRVSMNQANANKILEELWHWSNANPGVAEEFLYKADTQTQTQKNLVSVAKFIYTNQFEKEGWVNKETFIPAITKLLSGVKFVELMLDNQPEAISVFDHINDRGLNLTSADIIKNRIFQSVDNDEDFTLISESWQRMSSTLNKAAISRLYDPKYLLRALAWTRSEGKKITYDGLTDFWKKIIDSKEVKAIDFAQDLETDSVFLRKYSEQTHDQHGFLPELQFAFHLKSVQHYPLLLAIRNYQDPKVFKRVIKQIHNRTTFYVLAQERTQSFETIIPRWASALFDLGPKATIQEVDKIYTTVAPLSESDFDKLNAEFMGWNYDSASDRVKIRGVLSHLSWLMDSFLNKPQGEVKEYFKTRKAKGDQFGWDIDHIFPSKLAKNDPSYQSIGNLVLLYPQDNRGLKDVHPSEKKKPYLQHPLALTRTAAGISNLADTDLKKLESLFSDAQANDLNWNLSTWDEKSVAMRANFYFALLKHDLTTF